MDNVEASIIIYTSPHAVINAFLEDAQLKNWWGVDRCLIQPNPGGLYLLAWKGSQGGFNYVNTGIIKFFEPGLFLEIEKLSYLDAERSILGPMNLLIECSPHNSATYVHVCQSGYQKGGDWEWFYESVKENWPVALQQLKHFLERP